MMDANNPIERAITDARALLDTLLTSGWQDMHVVSGDTEIFVAQAGGRPNPMRVAPVSELAMQPVSAQETAVAAPHVATLVDMLAVGTAVKAGQTVATIRVLDDEEVLTAPIDGRIATAHVQAGSLVEFGAPILSIAQAA